MSTEKKCQSCGAEADLNLCNTCEGHLEDALEQLPMLLLELQTTITRQDRLNLGVVGKASDTPSPVNWGASRLADEAEDLLVEMVDTMVSAGLKFFPAMSVGHLFIGPLRPGWQRLPKGYSGSPQQRARWLAHHVHEIAKHPQAGEMYRSVTELTGDPNRPSRQGRILRAIDRTIRVYIGPCPNEVERGGKTVLCGHRIDADEGQDVVECSKCGNEVDVKRTKSKNLMSRDLFTEKDLIEVMAVMEEPIYADLVQKWLKQGRLTPSGYFSVNKIVAERTSPRDARLFSLSRVRQLRWQDLRDKAEAKAS